MSEETDIFREEAFELLEEIESSLLQLKDTPQDAETINKLFRNLHTIKGSGAMFGFENVSEFTHELEDVVDMVRKGSIEFTVDLVDPFLAGRDFIVELIDSHGVDGEVGELNGDKIIEGIKKILNGSGAANSHVIPKMKMLIVEDEFSCRFILQEFLSDYGETHVAIDGYEAVTAIKISLTEKKPYDLICLDIMMPGIDGEKVSEEIRRLENEAGFQKHCKIVITSSLDDHKKIDMMINKSYCDLFLKKPVSLLNLAQFIEKVY